MDPSFQAFSSTAAPPPGTGAGVFDWAKRVALVILLCLVLLVTVATLAVSLIDWNRTKPWVVERVSEATGRYFQIRGALDARWIWPQPFDSGWRHWVPGVNVKVSDIELGNRPGFAEFGSISTEDGRNKPPLLLPSDAILARDATSAQPTEPFVGAASTTAPPVMARVAEIRATLRLLPLLRKMVLIDRVELQQPDLALARFAGGDNNWTFPTLDEQNPKKRNPWSVEVGEVGLSSGHIAYADASQKLAVRALVDSIAPADARGSDVGQKDALEGKTADGAGYGIAIKLTGRYRDAEVSGSGRAGQLLSLRQTEVRYPIEFKLAAGNTTASIAGSLLNPQNLNGVDMTVALASNSMSDLYDLTGLALPRTPPFETSGHLVGNLEPERATWDYENFTGVVGKSDLQGHLSYTSGASKPKLTGQVKSRRLQLSDLGPTVGVPKATARADDNNRTPPQKVLPHAKFETGRWDTMDLDIAFLGERLIGPAALPLDDMSVRAIVKDGVVNLDPLRFGIAKGRIDAKIELDGHSDPLDGRIRATVDDLQLSALFPKVDLLNKSFGRMDGAFALSGRGSSIASLLAKSNGEFRVYIRDGTFSKQMLDLAALNLGSVLATKIFGPDEEVKLRCAVADLSVKNGIAQTRSVKLSTSEAVIEAVGTLDFGHEYMDLRVKPESLEWKFLSLRTPLHVRGPFVKPEVTIEAAPLLARAGAAIVAAALAPAALALIPITVPAAEDDENCVKLLARADAAVKAGPRAQR